jgi:hypothetical protein
MLPLPVTVSPDRDFQGSSARSRRAAWMVEKLSTVRKHWRICATIYLVIVLGIIVASGVVSTLFRSGFHV